MPVIAIVNRKGGSGKSTLATHIAAYCANQDFQVMLGDVDRQQSTLSWIKQREQHNSPLKPIKGWAIYQTTGMRAPAGTSHVVLDTPGGIHGLDLARVVMFADMVLIPLCNSTFDRDSAHQCYLELKSYPRVSAGRCKVAVVGMRLENRSDDSVALASWANERQLPFVGALRNAPIYVDCIGKGITIFDLPKESASQDLAQWQPILDWMRPTLFPQAAPEKLLRPSEFNSSPFAYKPPAQTMNEPKSNLSAIESLAKLLEEDSNVRISAYRASSPEIKPSSAPSFRLPSFLQKK